MPEVAPLDSASITRRNLLLGVGAVATVVALPQVSVPKDYVVIPWPSIPEFDYVDVIVDSDPGWVAAWEQLGGEALDRWAKVWGLERDVIWKIGEGIYNGFLERHLGSHIETDDELRQRILVRVLELEVANG